MTAGITTAHCSQTLNYLALPSFPKRCRRTFNTIGEVRFPQHVKHSLERQDSQWARYGGPAQDFVDHFVKAEAVADDSFHGLQLKSKFRLYAEAAVMIAKHWLKKALGVIFRKVGESPLVLFFKATMLRENSKGFQPPNKLVDRDR